MIACFLSNISAKYYKNPSMLSRVIAKNVGDVFFETQCILYSYRRYWTISYKISFATKSKECKSNKIVEGTPGIRAPGRPHTTWQEIIGTWRGLSLVESVRATRDSSQWRKIVRHATEPRTFERCWRQAIIYITLMTAILYLVYFYILYFVYYFVCGLRSDMPCFINE